jgi:2-polyprenyl-3-methyl-5-hydroxy-6-metoxy-1,4-benzoquinol methylase
MGFDLRLCDEEKSMEQWYEKLFANYARTYDTEIFTQGTLQEVGFIERVIGRNKQAKILDVGCGTGRHSIELARRGYNVTGIDLSAAQLKHAREKAKAAGVSVRFIHKDARKAGFRRQFDLVIMLCEGGFSLMATDEENYAILASCAKALKKGGRFVFTALNALFPLANSPKEMMNDGTTSAQTRYVTFDVATLRDRTILKTVDDGGREMTLYCNERYYVPSELRWMLQPLGFKDIGIFGCTVGRFSRKVKPSSEEFELLAIAVKNS